MDPFTERMRERAKARREKLDQQLNNVGQASAKKRTPLFENNPSVTDISSVTTSKTSSPVKNSVVARRKSSSRSPLKLATPASKQSRFSPRKSPRHHLTPPPPPRQETETETETEEEEPTTVTDSDGRTEAERQIEMSTDEDSQGEGESDASDAAAAITDGVRSRLKRLGALYSDAEQLSSPIHRTENHFSAEPVGNRTRNKSATRSVRLAALASTINQWEDDMSHPSVATATARVKPPATMKGAPKFSSVGVKRKSVDKTDSPRKIAQISATKAVASSRSPGTKYTRRSGGLRNSTVNSTLEVTGSPRQLQWDKSMLDSLESQGFTRTNSNSRLIYDFEQERHHSSSESEGLQGGDEYHDGDDEDEEESPRKRAIDGSPIRATTTASPSRSPMVMGVTQLRNNISPVKSITTGSPCKSATSPVKSQFKVALKPGNAVDNSQPEGSVLQRAAKYESDATSPTKRATKDPAELPLSERMALFEKNKGPLLVPKVPFSTPMPAKLLKESEKAPPLPNQSTQKPAGTSCPTMKDSIVKMNKSPQKPTTASTKSMIEESAVFQRLRMFENGEIRKDDSPSRPQNQAIAERQKEMEMLSSRWTRNKEVATTESVPSKMQISPVKASHNVVAQTPPPPPPPLPKTALTPSAMSPISQARQSPRRPATKEAYPGVTDVKRIKVSPPKPGHLYPSLSDMEATTEAEVTSADNSLEDSGSSCDPLTDDDNSFGKDILEAAEKVHSSYRAAQDEKGDVSVTESAVLRDMDDFLEEALDESAEVEEDEDEDEPAPSKKTRTTPSKRSDSFTYKQEPSTSTPLLERKSPRRSSKKYPAPPPPSSTEALPTHVVEGDTQVPLMHTVSFYRRQQNMTPRTPARQVQRQTTPERLTVEDSSSGTNKEEERSRLELQVRQLLDEVSKQTTVISQASQALNLCNATVEFSGSSEQVEGERLLLLATHKRQAALNEVQRLKVEGTLRPQNPSGHDVSNFCERGTLHISEITLPVKRDFVRSISAEDNSHHFVCLAKCQDMVLATSVLSIANTRELQGGQALRFPSPLTLADLFSNFRVTLEVYTMTSRKEMLPHDIKYHIKKDGSKHRMTPKKQKQDSHLLRPPVQSPAGPNAVRSPQFSLIGYVIFSLREIQRTSFTLNKVPYTSPLEGSVQLRLSCDLSLDIEHRGFLTMFEDVSGFGAWHRRWCLLKGEMLSYWKYPDDEKKKVAIGSIDLRSCITETVGVVPRDICARLNTFLLETSRSAKPSDEDSLVLTCKGDTTVVRHLLSADTREERMDWCTQVNRALTVIRAWGSKTDV